MGLILEPIMGYRTGGLKGLLAGGVKGSIGFIAKPLYGLLQYTSKTLTG
jgi:hypothetical protein